MPGLCRFLRVTQSKKQLQSSGMAINDTKHGLDCAWCLVCELCLLTVVWADGRCFLSWVFRGGGARRLELSPCNTKHGTRKSLGYSYV